jgi:hypothetical protein
LALTTNAQTQIRGQIVDNKSKKFLSDVQVRNVHSNSSTQSKQNGAFEIIVKSGELIQFEKEGYEIVRIRIKNEKQPLFYNLHLDKMIPRLDPYGHLLPYQKDSLEFDAIYGIIIHGERKEDVDMRSLPLAALSKYNRDKWAFQDMFIRNQNEKYVDFVFNKQLVKEITALEGDDLDRFMKFYRPSYSFLRSATEYEYLDYIKRSYKQFQIKENY